MTGPGDRVLELLAERPELEPAVQELVSVEREQGPWTFDDADLDSGTFGEIVSQDFVEEVSEGYRFVDLGAVEAGLTGESKPDSGSADESSWRETLRTRAASVDQRTTGALLLGLAFVAIIRIGFTYDATFRNGDIVLASNDPYFYRFWIEQLLEGEPSAFTLDGLRAESLPSDVAVHDVLMILFGWWAAAGLGGGSQGAGLALAWYPPIFGVLSAALVYVITVLTFEDRPTGLIAVGILAVTPAHAVRTALGFGDHHAFDIFLVGLTAWGLVLLAVGKHRGGQPFFARYGGAAILGIGVAALTLAWRAGPLFLFPIALYVFLEMLLDVHDSRSPASHNVFLLSGIGAGMFLTLGAHLGLGLVEPFRGFAPLLLFAGAALVVVICELVHRLWSSTAIAVAGCFGSIGPGALIAWTIVPDVPRATEQFIQYMTRTTGSGIAETSSLFTLSGGGFLGSILLFGLFLFIAVPYLVWTGFRLWRGDDPVLLVAVTFAAFFLLLATIQNRFTGSLSLFVAVFAGLGFRHLLSVLEIGARPQVLADGNKSSQDIVSGTVALPDRQTLLYLGVFILVVMGPGLMQTAVKAEQLEIDDSTYGAATAIEDYASTAEEPPAEYAFSQWGTNRVYNHFLDGDSQSYWYARTYFDQFLTDTRPGNWTGDAHGRQIGYVVVTDVGDTLADDSMYKRLSEYLGSSDNNDSGLDQFRMIYISPDENTKVFAIVSGHRLTGEAAPNMTLSVSKRVTVSGQTFTYECSVNTDETGSYTLQVPYSGQYQVGNQTVNVGETA